MRGDTQIEVFMSASLREEGQDFVQILSSATVAGRLHRFFRFSDLDDAFTVLP
ncbi:MAG: hypothetical protein ACREM8_03485 [Vulcanimicrobiaceae bacterium]